MPSNVSSAADEGIIPVIIDSGSKSCRVGFAGDDTPKVIYNCSKFAWGQNPAPIQRGRVADWESLEALWSEALIDKEIGYVDSPILFTEATLLTKFDREKTTQVAFESFNSTGTYLTNQAAMALYANGMTTGLVLDSGHGITHSVPVIEGSPFYSGIVSMELAGMDLTEYLQKFTGRSDYCEMLKEKACEVSLNPQKIDSSTNVSFSLPDGQEILVGKERYLCPEILFQPRLLNRETNSLAVHEAIYHSVQRFDHGTRRDLYSNIVLAGGSTMFQNFDTRLTRELTTIVQLSFKVAVSALPEGGKYSSWLGASILASLSTFQKMWITKQDYHEWGPAIVHRKCN